MRDILLYVLLLVLESAALLNIVKVLHESCYRLHRDFPEICHSSGFLHNGRKKIMKDKRLKAQRLVKKHIFEEIEDAMDDVYGGKHYYLSKSLNKIPNC